MRTGLLIYNPESGDRRVPKMLDDLLAYGLGLGLVLVPYRLGIGDASGGAVAVNRLNGDNLLMQLILAPWTEFAIVSGGDGTLSSVSELIYYNRPDLPVGFIPSGTCNDFANSLRLPQDERECIGIVAAGNTTQIDVGCVDGGRIFLSACAAGMFVKISYSTDSFLKKSIGPLAYYFSALGELPNIKPFSLMVETESEAVDGNFLLFLLINGDRAAGLANLYSKAVMTDGYMDLMLIRDVPPLELPNLFGELLNRESIDAGQWFRRLRASRFKFTGPNGILTTLDGEEGPQIPIEVEVLPGALKVFTR